MLTSLGFVLLLGLVLGTLATKLRLPSLVGMLLAGILLGPCVLNLLSPSCWGSPPTCGSWPWSLSSPGRG